MKLRLLTVSIFFLGAVAFGILWFRPARGQGEQPTYPLPTVAFHGESRDLKQTVVVPSLDSAMPQGKNVIWCGTFQMAWDHLRADVIGEPVAVANAGQIVSWLNRGTLQQKDLPENCCYSVAGLGSDGIADKIRRDMRQRFARRPSGLSNDAIVAYGYLRAKVPFTLPYFENRDKFIFTDSLGGKTAVSSFGIRQEDEFQYSRLRQQVEVLYCPQETHGGDATEFAIDMCRDAKPSQIVLACVPRKETLRETLDYLNGRMIRSPGSRYGPHPICDAVVLVPNMNWSIDHHFSELEGHDKQLLNRRFKGLYLATALQAIDFHLNRGGVELGSEAKVMVAPIPINYIVNRPFLIYLKKRGAASPYFVMWVDNAELLSKPEAAVPENSKGQPPDTGRPQGSASRNQRAR